MDVFRELEPLSLWCLYVGLLWPKGSVRGHLLLASSGFAGLAVIFLVAELEWGTHVLMVVTHGLESSLLCSKTITMEKSFLLLKLPRGGLGTLSWAAERSSVQKAFFPKPLFPEDRGEIGLK